MLDERQQQRGQIALQKIYELRDLINEGIFNSIKIIVNYHN